MTRSTRLEVDLDAIGHNLREVRGMLGSPAPLLAAVLKADGYGLGAVRVAKELLAGGVDMLAVACLPEAIELRGHFAGVPVLVMGHTPDEYLGHAVRQDLVTTISGLRQARILSRIAVSLGCRARAHVKLDTGMHRLGIVPGPDTPGLLARMAALPGLELGGIFTHLALRDADSDRRQFDLFMEIVSGAASLGVSFPLRHVCDSIGLMRYPEYRLDMVRAGAVLLGVRPMRTPLYEDVDIFEVAALRSRIARLARVPEGEGVSYDSSWTAPAGGALVATLPVGYADGYKRCLSNKARVLVRGARAPVVGLICMDQLMVDVSGVPSVAEGDEVLLFGSPGGAPEGERISLLEVADWAGTNRNEIISSIGRRVPRVYLREGREAEVVDYLLDREDRHG
ncbi:MAG: alanine racemase [Spirochaetes bacterium]|nr:alanine racemase [Spirochaetota bacterium]